MNEVREFVDVKEAGKEILKAFDHLLALMTRLSGKVFNKIKNDLRIHAWIKHMVHIFTFHLLYTTFL